VVWRQVNSGSHTRISYSRHYPGYAPDLIAKHRIKHPPADVSAAGCAISPAGAVGGFRGWRCFCFGT